MPRGHNADVVSAAEQNSIYPIQLIKFQLEGILEVDPVTSMEYDSSLYVTTCYKPIEYQDLSTYDDTNRIIPAKTYIAGANVVSLSAFEETNDVKTNAITVQLNGVPNTIIGALEGVEAIGGKVTIFQAFWNEETNEVFGGSSGIYQKWAGLINSHSVDEENQERGNVRINVECKNLLGAILNTKSGRYTSDASFTNTNSNDRSMEFVASLVNFNPKFGAEE